MFEIVSEMHESGGSQQNSPRVWSYIKGMNETQ